MKKEVLSEYLNSYFTLRPYAIYEGFFDLINDRYPFDTPIVSYLTTITNNDKKIPFLITIRIETVAYGNQRIVFEAKYSDFVMEIFNIPDYITYVDVFRNFLKGNKSDEMYREIIDTYLIKQQEEEFLLIKRN